MSDIERIRLVLLGSSGVGKSAIVKRFLFNTYLEKYKPTVEDLYNREYDLGKVTLKVDILDTAGDIQFPAMRRLSVATAHAFLLVYGVDSKSSFDQVKACLEEIREQRADFQEVPIVITGNKCDLAQNRRQVSTEEVSLWVHENFPKLRVKTMECSAKENDHVKDLFREFLRIANLSSTNGENTEEKSGIRRRSSTYTRNPKFPNKQGNTPDLLEVTANCEGFSGESSEMKNACENNSFPPCHLPALALSRNKPRSRSLIRRSSRKAKQQVGEAAGTETSDCRMT